MTLSRKKYSVCWNNEFLYQCPSCELLRTDTKWHMNDKLGKHKERKFLPVPLRHIKGAFPAGKKDIQCQIISKGP